MPKGFKDPNTKWFLCHREEDDKVAISDMYLSFLTLVSEKWLHKPCFNLINGYTLVACRAQLYDEEPPFSIDDLEGELKVWFPDDESMSCAEDILATRYSLELNANRLPGSSGNASSASEDYLPALQRNAASPRDLKHLVPEPIVVVIYINGHPVRALLDSGSLADFMSAKLAHQLQIQSFELVKPLLVHLAIQDSRAKINMECKATIRYQGVNEERYFDIVNLLNYNLILSMPFLFQHQVSVSMNPTTVVVGSDQALPMEGKSIRVLASRAAELYEDRIEAARELLCEYAESICRDASDAPLPPLHAVNHTIPLKDPNKMHSWRPSKCPNALRASWVEKQDAYLKSSCWKMTLA
ncbi:hypothetical protein K474DRAFT_1608059 [Panus rudis PR-1116 ss-1]|nr:hypothetical protein K474DRAFT_1608059 [Panus rudis PR-1116 ss-1]